ncbi:MAG: CHAP domain-containing protein [Candidatus Microsaccharimonas sossegonensis]|uniref:CHAP domain-containing protein n=1 Tax=Candidatus Microsaccharimonas sossegonensis TaxID=2506948 RepID=A0A4V1J7G3_9BACT|nr:MAG: CHAP domain-containing protein [Candidatus Microsaccharimonas sossegonensis]
MKLNSTTPVSRSRIARIVVFITISALMIIGLVPISRPAAADQFDEKINALTQDMARYQAQADQLNAQADTLQNALAQLANDKNALQTQINLNQAQSDKLVVQIADTQTQITANQDALGKTIADLYIDDGTTPIELLASSTNIGDFLNKQEYRSSVKTQLNDTIKKVKTLKSQLDTQKADLDKVLAQQTAARDDLATKESQQATLLAKTQNDEANYQTLIKNSAAEIASAKALQAAIRARSNATGGYSLVDAGSLPGYPWNSANCPMLGYLSTGGTNGNGSDGRGYGCRQCVSYVAYRIAQVTGVYYTDLGDGGQTAQNLVDKHGWKNLGNKPQPGSVGSLWGSPGHAAYVEAVDGNYVIVTQYNYNYGSGYGMYSKMRLSASFFNQYAMP